MDTHPEWSIDSDTLAHHVERFRFPVEVEAVKAVLAEHDQSVSLLTGDGGKGVLGNGPVFVSRLRAEDVAWDVLTAASVFALTGSASVASAAQALQRAVRVVKLLDPEECDVAIVMKAVSGGLPYTRHVTLQQIERQYEEDAHKVRSILARMERKGVIEGSEAAGWRLRR